MALYTSDADELSCTVELDTEPAQLDLTRGAGHQILDRLASELLAGARNQHAPNGMPWQQLHPKTVHRKRSTVIGFETGDLFARLKPGRVIIEPRHAIWTLDHDGHHSTSWGKAHGFHHGGRGRPARPLVGWPDTVRAYADSLLQTKTS